MKLLMGAGATNKRLIIGYFGQQFCLGVLALGLALAWVWEEGLVAWRVATFSEELRTAELGGQLVKYLDTTVRQLLTRYWEDKNGTAAVDRLCGWHKCDLY
jgi:hypothetical protein